MSGELLGQRVILLRSPPDNPADDPYTALLESAGFIVRDVPSLSFQYEQLDSLLRCLQSPSEFAGLVFTSPRAALAAGEAAAGSHLPAEWADKPCYVVGGRTDALIKNTLGLTATGADSGNAANLAQLIISQHRNELRPLLFPSGNLKRDTLPSQLEQAGIPLHAVTVYIACPHPDMQEMLQNELEVAPDYIVYFSPSAVNFSKDVMMRVEKDVRHVAIGPSTREALKLVGRTVFGSAAKPCPEAVLEVLQSALN